MPRPTKKPRERREKMIGVVCTTDEYEAIRKRAFEAHKSLGAYLRELGLGQKQATK